MKIRKNDTIIVTAGKDRGKQGKVEKASIKDSTLLIPGLNTYKKHKKPQGEGRPGEILTLSRPYTISKVALVCPKCKQQTRVGYKYQNDKKVRVCRKCNENID